ncbi:MAG: AAA-like domain-containing protein [Thiomargarita sp.]|nr:AAA-like domain-containing protein [Thiomargarita sp.]
MRKFSSYGPVDPELHYYVPRQELVNFAYQQLLGDNPEKGGHYITVWAPRQTGKTWIMQEVFFKLQQGEFDVVYLPLQHLSHLTDINRVAQVIAEELIEELNLEKLTINSLEDFHKLFKRGILSKPLILIFDEFDALSETIITELVGVFRNIYHRCLLKTDKHTKNYLIA